MDLDACRNEIDRIDKEMTSLLEERMKMVAAVAAYKEAHRMAVFDGEREAAVLSKIAGLTADKELVPYLKRIYQKIMDESKAYEQAKIQRD